MAIKFSKKINWYVFEKTSTKSQTTLAYIYIHYVAILVINNSEWLEPLWNTTFNKLLLAKIVSQIPIAKIIA